jgi:hypothetical protein
MRVAVQNTDLPSMNDILRAYGRLDVATGKFSVCSEVSIQDGDMHGYVAFRCSRARSASPATTHA